MGQSQYVAQGLKVKYTATLSTEKEHQDKHLARGPVQQVTTDLTGQPLLGERESKGQKGIRVGPGGGGGARGNGCSLPFTPQSLWHQRMKCSSHKLLPWKN